MDQFMTLLVLTFATWFVGYGTAMVVGQHGRYARVSQRALRGLTRLGGRGVRWFWVRYRTQIIWAGAGAALALYFLGRV